jgi:hypothetical protein
VRVKDRLPAGLTFGSMATTRGSGVRRTPTPPATMGGTVACTARQLAAHSTMTVTLAKAGTLTDNATGTASNVTADADDNATAPVTAHGPQPSPVSAAASPGRAIKHPRFPGFAPGRPRLP